MRKLLIVAAASLALAGCQTIDTIDAYIKKTLPIYCSGLEVAQQAFLVAHAARPFSANVLAAEQTAYASAKELCDNPASVNSVKVLTTVLTTAIQINAYIRQAQEAGVR